MIVKKVKSIKNVKYTPKRKKAHLFANKKEKKKFGNVKRIKGLKKEFAGDFTNKEILINKKVTNPEDIKRVIYHESEERKELNRILGKLKR